MSEYVRLPDEETKVKLALCDKCNGVVTAAVSHTMTKQTKLEMAKEAVEYNHSIKEVPLLDFRKPDLWPWCKCR